MVALNDADAETMLCHLGYVSYKLGRDVRFDREKAGDMEANSLFRKEYPAGTTAESVE